MDLRNPKDYKFYKLTGLEKPFYVLHNHEHHFATFWKNDNIVSAEVNFFFFLLLKMFVHRNTKNKALNSEN